MAVFDAVVFDTGVFDALVVVLPGQPFDGCVFDQNVIDAGQCEIFDGLEVSGYENQNQFGQPTIGWPSQGSYGGYRTGREILHALPRVVPAHELSVTGAVNQNLFGVPSVEFLRGLARSEDELFLLAA